MHDPHENAIRSPAGNCCVCAKNALMAIRIFVCATVQSAWAKHPAANTVRHHTSRRKKHQRNRIARSRGRGRVHPLPPAQIPASGITAQGSSDRVGSAHDLRLTPCTVLPSEKCNSVGIPYSLSFRGSMAGLPFPLSTLRTTHRDVLRMTRGQSDSPFLLRIEFASTTICRLALAHCNQKWWATSQSPSPLAGEGGNGTTRIRQVLAMQYDRKREQTVATFAGTSAKWREIQTPATGRLLCG